MPVLRNNDLISRDRSHFATLGREDNGVGIPGYFLLQAGANKRRLGNNEWHALALHVRTHQRSVCVVVLKKWNQARRHRHQLLGRHVHVMHLRRIDLEKVAAIPHRYFFSSETPSSVNWRVRLRDEEVLFAVAREIVSLIRHPAVFDLAIRRLDKAEFIDAGEGAHRTDQADIWTFRGLNRANATVMRRMNVAHLEPCAFTAQASRPKR